MFLLGVGFLTLMSMASLMVLAIPCPSIPYTLKFSTDVSFGNISRSIDVPKGQRNHYKTRVTSYTGINMAGLNVMMSTLGSQPEPLKKGTEST